MNIKVLENKGIQKKEKNITVNQRVAGSSPAGGAKKGGIESPFFLCYALPLHFIFRAIRQVFLWNQQPSWRAAFGAYPYS